MKKSKLKNLCKNSNFKDHHSFNNAFNNFIFLILISDIAIFLKIKNNLDYLFQMRQLGPMQFMLQVFHNIPDSQT